MSWFFYAARIALRGFFFVLTNLKISGKENTNKNRPLIVVANHMTFAEPPIIGMILKGKMRFAAKEELFRKKPSKVMMEALGCFPVYRQKADRKTIRLMEEFVHNGYALIIFPEGKRSVNSELLPALTGAALIANHTHASILPVGIYGTEQLRKPFWFLKRPKINVRFGKPFTLPADENKLSRDEATRYIMKHITDLLPSDYHGAYATKGME